MDFFLQNGRLDLSLLDHNKQKNVQETAKPYLTEEISTVLEKMSIYLEEDAKNTIDDWDEKINIQPSKQIKKEINLQVPQSSKKEINLRAPQSSKKEINLQAPQSSKKEINLQAPQSSKKEIPNIPDENEPKPTELESAKTKRKNKENSKNDLELKQSLIGRIVTKDIVVKGICVVAKNEIVDWDIIEESDEGGFLIKLLINSEKIPS
ncbi:hypothetical protein AN640_07875 [Candidatus Epulonipiscium fishelsonii]|uniref:Uncharacterized protein n=1 Tax=Candidatus Epulonipiscium fishelsonii TaxID=77094 RepID=A0ACC8XEQ3_9FIRM|nr:hypothetical protein AN640_07875 [Epulopiscium sp. SCG-D08WGA-EpuloA1]